MRLSRQLGIISLTLLLVPWAGCEFLAENERALRTAQQQAASAVARTSAAALADQDQLLHPPNTGAAQPDNIASLLVRQLTVVPAIDGWLDDWEGVPARVFGHERRQLSLQLGQTGDALYLAARIREPERRYRSPQSTELLHSDHLLLTLGDSGQSQLAMMPEGPGQTRVWIVGPDDALRGTERAARARWQETAEGYQVELSLPLSLLNNQLRVEYVGVDDSGAESIGNHLSHDRTAVPRLVRPAPAIDDWLARVALPGMQVSLYDRWQWPLGTSRAVSPEPASDTFWLMRWLYRQILPGDNTTPPLEVNEAGRVVTPLLDRNSGKTWLLPQDSASVLMVSAPILDRANQLIGVVTVTQPVDEYLSLTDTAFTTLLGRGLTMLVLTALTLLGFAAVMSWRVKRLTRMLSISGRESHAARLPVSPLNDEIDELAARFNEQFAELADYQHYLKSLNNTLAHELRTPVAIVASSLDNLQEEGLTDAERNTLIERSRVGIGRLQTLFAAMQEARRLEQTVSAEPLECINLRQLLTHLVAAYAQTDASHQFVLRSDSDEAIANVAPDRVVQALDKLVDNAISFAPEQTTITLHLEARGLWWRIGVENIGPTLPDTANLSLFEPLISRRPGREGDRHMGLGLHIVRLVARHHGGEPFAHNLDDGSGVRFGFSLRADLN